MKYNNHNKGFTLIELIIVLGITGVVITAIFSFFLTNIKTFHRADDQVEVQYNAQVAMNEMVDNIMGTEKIKYMMPNVYSGNPMSITNIVFKINDNKYIRFNYNATENILYSGSDITSSGETSITTNQYATNITDFKVELIGVSNVNFDPKYTNEDNEDLIKKVKGVEIIITSKKNDSKVTLKNKVYFRNAKK